MGFELNQEQYNRTKHQVRKYGTIFFCKSTGNRKK